MMKTPRPRTFSRTAMMKKWNFILHWIVTAHCLLKQQLGHYQSFTKFASIGWKLHYYYTFFPFFFYSLFWGLTMFKCLQNRTFELSSKIWNDNNARSIKSNHLIYVLSLVINDLENLTGWVVLTIPMFDQRG